MAFKHGPAKFTKEEVGYESPAKGSHHCKSCKHFEVIAPNLCEIVAGKILPQDWCQKWSAK